MRSSKRDSIARAARRGQMLVWASLTFIPLPAVAATTYPLPGTYEGTTTLEDIAGCCWGVKVGETSTLIFQYQGPNAAEYKYWETASSNPPGIGKAILTVQTGRGTSSQMGSSTYVGYTKPTGISRTIEGGWFATFGYFDANSFTLVLTEALGSVSVEYDIALTRTGGLPASE